MDSNENKNSSGRFSNFMNKASDIGKKAADSIQKGAKKISEETQKTIYEQRLKKYNPLFKEDFKSKKFKLPNVIEIVDDAVRKNIDVCEGAIGWTDIINDVEVLHLYDEYVKDSKIHFYPVVKCDMVYCVDAFDKSRFVSADTVFASATSEKIAELEHIAYSLGAKTCSIEIMESSAKIISAQKSFEIGMPKNSIGTDKSESLSNQSMQSGKVISRFEGNNDPKEPSLKWFANDDNIKGLIAMRCSSSNAIKSKILKLQGSSSATMSQKTACAIDKILKIKASISMEKQSVREHSSVLVFEVEF